MDRKETNTVTLASLHIRPNVFVSATRENWTH